ncbi:glycosyltransferase family 9 protein [Bergeyella sp. RCAD1439]|uniref:glycosyltransferase family 9 protein n=1 Tax=Bergeyella anatis TaxID=3113737 RepID=UPI002E18466A|nr:glycosyltransferase family 9 protein [Bergeyella sp. RCAD1439]
MTVPVLRVFLEQNPDVEVVMVSRKSFSGLFEGVDRLVFHGVDLNDYKGLLGMRRLFGELAKAYAPECVADLHDVIRSKILTFCFRWQGFKTSKINKGKKEKKKLTDVWNLDKKQLKTTVERYADVFRTLGFSVELSHELRGGKADKKGIGFAPFAQHKGKRLPLEKSYELAKALAQKAPVFFFGGGAEETALLERWAREIPNTQSYAGKLTLVEELAKIAELSVMVSMDSANMHLASLVGTRCVSVWGATHPYAGFLGYGQRLEDVVQVSDLTCRPCSVFGNKACFRGDYACLNELDISSVLAKI